MTLTSNFDKSGKGGGKPNKPEDEKDIVFYEIAGDPRNICFVQPDGRQQIFYYADIMQQEYDPNKSTLTLSFRTATVTIAGNNLEKLFEGFKTHTIKQIKCVEERYAAMKEETEMVVTAIEIKVTS